MTKTNKVHYTKWAKQIKDYIESKDPDGMELVEAMNWAVGVKKKGKVTDSLSNRGSVNS